MTRLQTAKLAKNLADSITAENERQKKYREEVMTVLRERWSDSQKNAMSALEKVQLLEAKVKGLEKARDHFQEKSEKMKKQLNSVQGRLVDQGVEISQLEQACSVSEEKYDALYERYQEMAIAAGSEIGGLEKTCQNQARVIDRVETERDLLKENIENFKKNDEIRKELMNVIEESLKPIETFMASVNTEAISAMDKALMNILSVQNNNFTNFKTHQEHSKKEDTREIPDEFICSVSGSIMDDPVMTSNGEVFDRSSIEQWQKQPESLVNSDEADTDDDIVPKITSPLTRAVIEGVFYPHAGLKRQIRDWKDEVGQKERSQLQKVLHNLKLIAEEAKQRQK